VCTTLKLTPCFRFRGSFKPIGLSPPQSTPNCVFLSSIYSSLSLLNGGPQILILSFSLIPFPKLLDNFPFLVYNFRQRLPRHFSPFPVFLFSPAPVAFLTNKRIFLFYPGSLLFQIVCSLPTSALHPSIPKFSLFRLF